jgi:hypothetical protein
LPILELLVPVAVLAANVREGIIIHGPQLGPSVDITQFGFQVQPFQRVHMLLPGLHSTIARDGGVARHHPSIARARRHTDPGALNATALATACVDS